MAAIVNSAACASSSSRSPSRSSSGAPRRIVESSTLYECISGYMPVAATVGANPYSELMQFTLPADYDTLQVVVFNAHNADVTGVKVSVGFGSTLGAANGTLGLAASGLPIGGTLTKCTQKGAATGTLTASSLASTGTSGANIGGSTCGYGIFDATYCPSVPRVDGNDRDKPVGFVSVTWPAAARRTFLGLDGTTSQGWQNEGSQPSRVAPFGHPRRVMVAANNDAQDNPALYLVSNGFAARTHTQFPAVMIIATLRGGLGTTLVSIGDSTRAATAASIQYCGADAELRALVSTPTRPMSVCNLAVPGSDMVKQLGRVSSVVALFAQANFVVPHATVNSLDAPITDSALNLIRKNFSLIRRLLDRPGLFMFTATCPPTNPAWKAYGTSDQLRVDANAYQMAQDLPCFPLSEAVSGPMVVVPSGPQAGQSQVGIAPLANADDIHFNSVGQRWQAERCYPVWMSA